MLTTKRVIIATVVGFLCGLICLYLATSNPDEAVPLSKAIKWTIVISRTMLGFTIGISAIRLTWWLHGLVLGVVASIPMAVPMIGSSGIYIIISTIVLGAVYGFLVELITTVFFKAKAAR